MTRQGIERFLAFVAMVAALVMVISGNKVSALLYIGLAIFFRIGGTAR